MKVAASGESGAATLPLFKVLPCYWIQYFSSASTSEHPVNINSRAADLDCNIDRVSNKPGEMDVALLLLASLPSQQSLHSSFGHLGEFQTCEASRLAALFNSGGSLYSIFRSTCDPLHPSPVAS